MPEIDGNASGSFGHFVAICWAVDGNYVKKMNR
jgi:hypothetical protein